MDSFTTGYPIYNGINVLCPVSKILRNSIADQGFVSTVFIMVVLIVLVYCCDTGVVVGGPTILAASRSSSLHIYIPLLVSFMFYLLK